MDRGTVPKLRLTGSVGKTSVIFTIEHSISIVPVRSTKDVKL